MVITLENGYDDRVQALDKDICISFNANTLRKSTSKTVLALAMETLSF